VCHFVIPPALPIQAAAFGSRGNFSLYVNGELQLDLPSVSLNASSSNNSTIRLPVLEAVIPFTDSAPMLMRAGAYQVHLVVNASALRPNFTEQHPSPNSTASAYLHRPWLLVYMSLQSSALLTGWQCRNVSNTIQLPALLQPIDLAQEERRLDLMEQLDESRPFTREERELLRWQGALLFHDNEAPMNESHSAPFVAGIPKRAKWMTVADRSAALTRRWKIGLSAEEAAADNAEPQLIVCRYLVSFGHTMLSNEVLNLAKRFALPAEPGRINSPKSEQVSSTTPPVSLPSTHQFHTRSLSTPVMPMWPLQTRSANPDVEASVERSVHHMVPMDHPGPAVYPSVAWFNSVDISNAPSGGLTVEEAGWLYSLGLDPNAASNPEHELPPPSTLPPPLDVGEHQEPLNNTLPSNSTTGTAGRRLLWDGRSVLEGYRYGRSWYWHRRTDDRWDKRGGQRTPCEWRGVIQQDNQYGCPVCPNDADMRRVCNWAGTSSRTWEQTIKARVSAINSYSIDRFIQVRDNFVYIPNNVKNMQIQLVTTLCADVPMEPNFEDRGYAGPGTSSPAVSMTRFGSEFYIQHSSSYNAVGNGWWGPPAYASINGRRDCWNKNAKASHWNVVLQPASQVGSFHGAPSKLANFHFYNEQPDLTSIMRLPPIRPTFTALRWCSATRNCERLLDVFTPAPTTEFGSSAMRRARTARMTLNHHNISTGNFQAIQLHLIYPGVDCTTVTIDWGGWELPRSCTANTGDRCDQLRLSSFTDPWFDKPLTIRYTLKFTSAVSLQLSSDTEDVWEYQIVFVRNEDSALRMLQAASDSLRTPFTHGGQQRVTAEYDIDIPRRHKQLPFSLSWLPMDPFALVTVDFLPPIRDNGPIDYARTPLRMIDRQKGEWTLRGLAPSVSGSQEYNWGVPFGESQLRVTVRDEKGTGVSTYRVFLHHRRHTENRIISLLSTLGVLQPAFNPNTYMYTLTMRVNDPTQQLRILLNQWDPFSNISATLRVPEEGETKQSGHGRHPVQNEDESAVLL
jgi:hypothetical protein